MKTEYKPGFYNKYGEWVDYEVRWYCNENKIIHQNIKERDNCKYCNKL